MSASPVWSWGHCIRFTPVYPTLSIIRKGKHPHFKLQTQLQPLNMHLNNSLGRDFRLLFKIPYLGTMELIIV